MAAELGVGLGFLSLLHNDKSCADRRYYYDDNRWGDFQRLLLGLVLAYLITLREHKSIECFRPYPVYGIISPLYTQ